MKRWFYILGLLTLLLLIAGCANSPDTTVPNTQQQSPEIPAPPVLTPEEIALGQTVYAANCASCHGEELEGEVNWKQQNDDGSFRPPPHTADGHTWHHADTMLVEAIKEGGARFEGLNIGGTSDMPSFADTLTDEEITAVLNYIKSTWPDDIRSMQWQQTVQSASQ